MPILMLNGDGRGPINNLCVPTIAAPSYGPIDRSLISVTTLKIANDHVDVTDSEFHEGISIRFSLNDRVANITGEAQADEDGVCEVELQPGEWRFFVNDETLPEGYCIYYPERSTKFNVVQSEEVQTAPPLYIGKGQLIQGKIVGKDLSEIRFDWITAAPKDMSASWYGRVNDRGEFRILVPNHVDLITISEFAIGNPGRFNRPADATNDCLSHSLFPQPVSVD